MKNKFENIVHKHLTPDREALLHNCVKDAIDEYSGYLKREKFSLRTDACIVNDLIINNAKHYFADDKGVHWKYDNNQFLLSFGNEAVIARFKKLDSHMRASNILTAQVLGFATQAKAMNALEQGILNFDEPLTKQDTKVYAPVNVNVGYYAHLLNYRIYLVIPQSPNVNFTAWELCSELDSGTVKNISINQKTKRKPVVRREKKAHDRSVGE